MPVFSWICSTTKRVTHVHLTLLCDVQDICCTLPQVPSALQTETHSSTLFPKLCARSYSINVWTLSQLCLCLLDFSTLELVLTLHPISLGGRRKGPSLFAHTCCFVTVRARLYILLDPFLSGVELRIAGMVGNESLAYNRGLLYGAYQQKLLLSGEASQHSWPNTMDFLWLWKSGVASTPFWAV